VPRRSRCRVPGRPQEPGHLGRGTIPRYGRSGYPSHADQGLRPMVARVPDSGTAGAILMAFNPLQLRFIRFLGPGKEPVEFPFKSGFNILYGSSDTGKTFLVEAIDFMLGAGDDLRDIP